jgi:hypothetical protein
LKLIGHDELEAVTEVGHPTGEISTCHFERRILDMGQQVGVIEDVAQVDELEPALHII